MANKDFKYGIFYSAVGKYSNVIVQFIVNMILARLLTPEDYGVVAIVQIFLAFFTMLSDMGIGPAIIQNKELSKDDISVIFKFSIYLAVLFAIIFVFMGYPVNLFYSDDVYIPIFIILGFSVFFHAVFVVPRALLLKDKDFKKVNGVDVLSSVIKGIVSIILAFLGFKYYALIIGGIVQAMMMFIFYYLPTKISPRTKLRKDPLLKIWSFSRNQFGFNFINYFSRNLDSILIGRYLSPGQLGYYNKAYQLSLYPNQILAGVITPVIQPILSDFENELDVIREVYLKITKILANIGVPLSIFFFFAADNIIFILFGDQWGASVMSFKILSVSVWIQMIASSTGAIYQSTNRTDLLLVSGIQSMVFNVVSIIIGVYIGTIESVSIMLVLSFLINFVFNNYLLMFKVFNSNFTVLIKSLQKPFIIGLLQIVVFVLMPDLKFSIFWNLFVQGIAFVTTFLVGLMITNQFKEIKSLVSD